MSGPLDGRTIALAEGRQLEELVVMLESEGATALRCPLLSILDAPDPLPVLAWIEDLIAGRFSWVVLMTGEAIRRLGGFAERAGRRDAFVEALGRTPTLTRGPKPVRALKEIGLTPTKVAAPPTTDGVIAALRPETLTGMTVGMTLYGAANPALEDYLHSAGAVVRPVMPYVFAPSADDGAGGGSDRPARAGGDRRDRLHQLAAGGATLRGGAASMTGNWPCSKAWHRTRVAAVGPVVAETLHGRQARSTSVRSRAG